MYGVCILKSLPGYAKVLLLLQLVIILFLSFWIYQEYQNNRYLRSYVGDNLQGTVLNLLFLVAIGSFIIIAVFLYARLRIYNRELERIVSTGKFGRDREGFVDRSMHRLKNILSRLLGRLRRTN
jgi:hypothetical protein